MAKRADTMKKYNVALRFLIAHGWVIALALLVIAALLYFGVLNPAKYLPM